MERFKTLFFKKTTYDLIFAISVFFYIYFYFQMTYINRLLSHILIALLFGYLYCDVGKGANTILANYVYLYGSLLLIVYTGKMSVTLSCKYSDYYITCPTTLNELSQYFIELNALNVAVMKL